MLPLLIGLFLLIPVQGLTSPFSPLFAEDGSQNSQLWWVSTGELANRVDWSRLDRALKQEQIEIRDLESGYEWNQDLLLFNDRGEFLVQANMPPLSSVLVGLTRGVFSDFEDQPAVRRIKSSNMQRLGLQTLELSVVLVEGGELISGRTALGEPYALMTEDVVERTRRFVSWMQSREVSIEEARLLVAKDLQVTLRNLHVLPFWRHLDLVIQAFPGGKILLDDFQKSTEVLRGLLRTSFQGSSEKRVFERMLKLHEEGHTRYYSEDAIRPEIRGKPIGPALPVISQFEIKALDRLEAILTAAGFEVTRVAGRFWDAPEGSWDPALRVNFLNGVVSQNSGGNLFVMTNSSRGLDSLEEYWREVLGSYGVEASRIHFPGFSDESSGFDCLGALSPAIK